MKYFIKTFGCQQNVADSERIAAWFKSQNYIQAKSYQDADVIIINTCMVRKTAENRVYGLVNNLTKLKEGKPSLKIIVTGCMVGMAVRDRSGKFLKRLKKIMPAVDEFAPIEKMDFSRQPLRGDKQMALVPISNGCNNFCTYCVVPFTRGREISRPFAEIIDECRKLKEQNYRGVMLLGQNVNSYGADLIKNKQADPKLKPVYVKHLGRLRLPTLFPHLLETVAKLGFEKVDFLSSNPWDYSDELIAVIAKYPNITRTLHLPLQSGDDAVLKRMNRWYTTNEYLKLVQKIKKAIPQVQFTTDIIVGFCGETDKEYQNTVKLCQKVNFQKAYVAMYSPRPFTAASLVLKDDVPYAVKKQRWNELDTLINKYPH